MYSVTSESTAFKTKVPAGPLKHTYPNTHKTSRFRPFNIATVETAFKSTLPSPTQNTEEPKKDSTTIITPLGVQDLKNLSQLQVYLIVREAVLQLRSSKAWKMDASQYLPKVSINLILVRKPFSHFTNPRDTIKQLLIPLSPDHI